MVLPGVMKIVFDGIVVPSIFSVLPVPEKLIAAAAGCARRADFKRAATLDNRAAGIGIRGVVENERAAAPQDNAGVGDLGRVRDGVPGRDVEAQRRDDTGIADDDLFLRAVRDRQRHLLAAVSQRIEVLCRELQDRPGPGRLSMW